MGYTWIYFHQANPTQVPPFQPDQSGLKAGDSKGPSAIHTKRIPRKRCSSWFSSVILRECHPTGTEIRWMEEILHQLIDGLSQQGFYSTIPGGAGFLPSTVCHDHQTMTLGFKVVRPRIIMDQNLSYIVIGGDVILCFFCEK